MRMIFCCVLTIPVTAAAAPCDVAYPGACVSEPATLDGSAPVGTRASVGRGAVLGPEIALATNVDVLPFVTMLGRQDGADPQDVGINTFIGRRASIGYDATIGNDNVIGTNARIGDDFTSSGLVVVGSNAIVGDDVTLGPEASIGNLAQLGDGSTLGEDAHIARRAVLTGDVDLGAFTRIGPSVRITGPRTIDTLVRVRRGATIGTGGTIGVGARIGRNVSLGDNVTIGDGAVVRSGATLEDWAVVADYGTVVRGATIAGSTIDIATDGSARSWSNGTMAASCDEYRNPALPYQYQGAAAQDGLYKLDAYGNGTVVIAYCDMSTTTGWTLAGKIQSGSGSNWVYASNWWTVPGAAAYGTPDLTVAEARYEPFDAMPFTGIRLVDPASGREVHLSDSATSLVDLFSNTVAPVPNGSSSNGGVPESPVETAATVDRYDATSFAYIGFTTIHSICNGAVTTVNTTNPIGINASGAYQASNGSRATGSARIGTWSSGSNGHIWSQTSSCTTGIGLHAYASNGNTYSGTTMGSFTTLWVK